MISDSPNRLEIELAKEYISKELRDGFSINDIKKALIQAGHPIEYIEKAIQEMNSSQKSQSIKEQKKITQPLKSTENKDIKNTPEITSNTVSFSQIVNLFFKGKIVIVLGICIIIAVIGYVILNNLPKTDISLSTEIKENNVQLMIMASKKNDVSYCSQITDHNMYYDCYDKIWLQKDNCRFQEITGLKRDDCYVKLALQQKNQALCFNIRNNKTKETCNKKIYDVLDANKCAEDYSCLEYWFDKAKNNDICRKIAKQNKKDDCFNVYAQKFNNITSCYEISDISKKELCIFNRLPLLESRKVISDENFFLFITSNGFNWSYDKYDVEDCSVFNFNSNQIDTIIPADYLNITGFSQDKSSLFMDNCYFIKSIESNDENICNNIMLEDIKKLCNSYFTYDCESLLDNEKFYDLCNSILNNCSTHTEMDVFCEELGIKDNGRNALSIINKGKKFYNQGNYDSAITLFKAAINLNPNQDEAYALLGNSYFHLKMYPNAIEYFNKAIGLNSSSFEGYIGLGWSYYHLEDYTKSLKYFRLAQNINPNNTDTYYGLGWSYYYLEEYNRTIDYFNKSISSNKNDSAYTGLGWSYYNLKMYTEAMEHFSRVLESESEGASSNRGIGIIYLENQEYDAALPYLKKSLALNNDNPYIYYSLARYYYETEDYPLAKEYIDICIKVYTNNYIPEKTELKQKIYEKISKT